MTGPKNTHQKTAPRNRYRSVMEKRLIIPVRKNVRMTHPAAVTEKYEAKEGIDEIVQKRIDFGCGSLDPFGYGDDEW